MTRCERSAVDTRGVYICASWRTGCNRFGMVINTNNIYHIYRIYSLMAFWVCVLEIFTTYRTISRDVTYPTQSTCIASRPYAPCILFEIVTHVYLCDSKRFKYEHRATHHTRFPPHTAHTLHTLRSRCECVWMWFFGCLTRGRYV